MFFQLNKTEKVLQDTMLEVEASMQANYGLKKTALKTDGDSSVAAEVVKDMLQEPQ
ncbi:MAG: hypothetical protein GX801_05510 [Fibrobacter sp.]|nr:hypothetical protein [Fibrobacter sp.]